MAELGVAASVIGIASLAIQVGNCVLKLKEFCDSVKEAPKDIMYITEEIEALSLVLLEIGTIDKQGGLPEIPSASATKCLDLCRKGLDVLKTVVTELDKETRRQRRLGGMKTVLKTGIIDKLRERLKNAQFMLLLSNQTYSM
jgi:hypothetical protein